MFDNTNNDRKNMNNFFFYLVHLNNDFVHEKENWKQMGIFQLTSILKSIAVFSLIRRKNDTLFRNSEEWALGLAQEMACTPFVFSIDSITYATFAQGQYSDVEFC